MESEEAHEDHKSEKEESTLVRDKEDEWNPDGGKENADDEVGEA
jgi:hypothetical protein